MERITQSVAKRVLLKAFLASDHISPATGKTIAVVISKNGAAFGNPSAGATNATEIGNGWYYVDLSTTDTGTLGPLVVRGTEGTIDPSEIAFSVEVAVASQSSLDTLANDVATPDEIADEVWDTHTPRTLTALDEDSTTLDLDATIRGAVGLASANLDTQLGDLPTNSELSTALAAANDAVLAAIAAGVTLTSASIDAILDDAIGDGTLTVRQALRVLVAGMAGKLSGAATTTITIRNTADSANVIVATVDSDGNRSAVTVTP